MGSSAEVTGDCSGTRFSLADQVVEVSDGADGACFGVSDGDIEELFCAKDDLYGVKSHGLMLARGGVHSILGGFSACGWRDSVGVLIDAIDVKRKATFEFENVPYACLEAEVTSPTARGGQTLVRLKMRNLLTSAVFEKTFKASDKFKEPDLELVPVSYLYRDGDGSHFLDQENYETLTLGEEMVGGARQYLVEGALLQMHKYNGNPIALQLPIFVELDVVEAEHGGKGDSSSGSGTKMARLETGLELRVPLFIKQGEKVKVATETGEFAGRA